MEWKEFAGILDALGWSQAGIARHLGLHPNTVSKWRIAGKVPKYASAYVELAFDVREILQRGLRKLEVSKG